MSREGRLQDGVDKLWWVWRGRSTEARTSFGDVLEDFSCDVGSRDAYSLGRCLYRLSLPGLLRFHHSSLGRSPESKPKNPSPRYGSGYLRN